MWQWRRRAVKRNTGWQPSDDTNLTISAEHKDDPFSLRWFFGAKRGGFVSVSWPGWHDQPAPQLSYPRGTADYFPSARVALEVSERRRNYLLLSRDSSSALKPNLIYPVQHRTSNLCIWIATWQNCYRVTPQALPFPRSLWRNSRSFIRFATVVSARLPCTPQKLLAEEWKSMMRDFATRPNEGRQLWSWNVSLG